MTISSAAVLCGLGLGTGLMLMWFSLWDVPARPRRTPALILRIDDQLTAIGLHRMTPAHLCGIAAIAGGFTAAVVWTLTHAAPLALCFAVFAIAAPFMLVRAAARRTAVNRRALWPEAIDHLSSAVRAGLSLPEAVAALAERGPCNLRPLFAVFAREYRATGVFSLALDRFKEAAADPVADRIAAALTVTRDVGGTDLGTLLRTLSHFLREDSRTRSELSARQSWTVTGARLAVTAPWVVLALLATRPETARAYSTAEGALLLGVGLVVSLLAYAAMKRIGRLPEEPRVLRS